MEYDPSYFVMTIKEEVKLGHIRSAHGGNEKCSLYIIVIL